MNIKEAYNIGIQKMSQHGLTALGWTLKLDNAKMRLGQCRISKKEIGLSKDYIEINDDFITIDTILHEIAHALEYVRYGTRGHGYRWKIICLEVGARPVARANQPSLQTPKGKYALVHTQTGEIFRYYYRLPRKLDLSNTYIKRRKADTLGKLTIKKIA